MNLWNVCASAMSIVRMVRYVTSPLSLLSFVLDVDVINKLAVSFTFSCFDPQKHSKDSTVTGVISTVE